MIRPGKFWTWPSSRYQKLDMGTRASLSGVRVRFFKVPTDQIAALIRANAGTWLAILAEDPELLARRVRDDRWSPLEYSCHVRDVFHVMDER